MYVIKNTQTGKYVAPSGSPRSYVPALQHARTFRSREAAEHERCPENEVVLSLEQAIGEGTRAAP